METKMTAERLKEIRERADKATEGQWAVEDDDGWGHKVYVVEPGFGTMYVCEELHQGYDDGKNDAEFIAEARKDVPDLLDEVERLRDFEAAIQELAIHEDDEWHAAELLDQIRKVVGND